MEGSPSDQNENRNVTSREWQSPERFGDDSAIERKRKYDYLAKVRTSRFMVRLMAGLAVRVASRRPPQEETTMQKKSQQLRLQKLWKQSTKRELKL